MPLYQRVHVVRSAFFHRHVFLVKPLFTTNKLIHPVTVYSVIKSVNSEYHIPKVFTSVHCTANIPRHFSYQRHENVTSFLLPSSGLLFSPGIESHPPPSTSKLSLLSKSSLPPETSSLRNIQHMSS